MSDLQVLREVGQLVRQPAFNELVEVRGRRTRRARLATASTLAVAAVAIVASLVATGAHVNTDPPPVAPTPSPTPELKFAIPAGQETIKPDIRPSDIHGYEFLATVTNSQPEHRGDSELSATATSHTEAPPIATYCRGGSDLWYFYDKGDGGGGNGQCSPDADMSLAPTADIYDLVYDLGGEPLTVRMWIGRPSAADVDCRSGKSDCRFVGESSPPPVVNPDAKFGFRIYEHEHAAVALGLFPDDGVEPAPFVYEALSSIDGVGWLLDRAVVAAPDADRLAFELPASEVEYVVDVYETDSPRVDRCLRQHKDEIPDFFSSDRSAYETARHEVCGADLRLVVDGARVERDRREPYKKGHFAELGTRLSPGAPHRVEVQVVRGDPRNIRYAVVVRTQTNIPPPQTP